MKMWESDARAASLETCDLLAEHSPMKDALSIARIIPGEQSSMTLGVSWMPMLLADSWVILALEPFKGSQHSLAKELGTFFCLTWTVLE